MKLAPSPNAMPAPKTLVITHDHCALHNTRMVSPERPKRLKWVMSALELLSRDIQRDLKDTPLEIRYVETSEAMLGALAEELVRLAHSGGGPSPAPYPTLMNASGTTVVLQL